MRSIRQINFVNILYRTAISYPAPINLSYFWNFGVYALACLAIQIVTGIVLAMHYIADTSLAFSSVEHIMRDVNYGWLLRYVHANGASMFFIVVYTHTFRGLYYSSFTHPRQLLWIVGVVILFLMIATAFLGYVLPWGQMSFWAATVITNLITAVPVVGKEIVIWLWGGFALNDATLTRFFSFHYLLPFIISALVAIHLILLHDHGSNNPMGINSEYDKYSFSPYYITKDLYGVILFFIFFSLFVFFIPNYLGHSDNYIPANPLVTPTHIVPEWYFLPFYAILRSIPDKGLGVLAMMTSIVILALIPFYIKPHIRSMQFRPISRALFWLFVVNCFMLGWLGGKSIGYPYLEMSQFFTISYFSFFFIIYPVVVYLENFVWFNHDHLHYIVRYWLNMA